MNTPDLQLASLCAAGDDAARKEFYVRFQPRIYSQCLRILKNPADAEDLAQDVFIQIFRKIGTFQGKSRLSTWTYSVAQNQVLMYLRRRTRVCFHSLTDASENVTTVVKGSENPRRMRIDNKILLENCIDRLPDGYRRVLLLFDVEGYTHAEIARRMGISEGTVKSQLSKARDKMRRLIKRKANPKLVPQYI